MRIAICDDFIDDAIKLSNMIEEIFKEKRINIIITLFDSGEKLLENIKKNNYDIYFLDIYLDKMDGIELGYKIVKKDINSVIIYTTNSKDHMADSYSVGALHYLVKPFDKDSLNEALNRCLRIIRHFDSYIELLTNRKKKKILLYKIKYIESQNRYCFIYTEDNKYKVYLRLEQLEKMLIQDNFLRCHRSYIINLDYISDINNSDFVLNDGTLIPLKRDHKKVFKTYYEDYLFKKIRRKGR